MEAVTFVPDRFAGKTALVTGSTRGLGRTIAEWFAREGCAVIAHGRQRDDVDTTVREITALGGRAFGLTADLSRVADAHALGEAMLEQTGQLDILINNAGMSIRAPFWEVSDDDWDYQTTVNYRAPYILAQHAARHMIDRAIAGRIVNTSTIGAHLCHTNAAVYDSSKGAVETMTRNMAWELGPHRITVNCVIPGGVPDRPGDSRNADWAKRISPVVPIPRVGSSRDIANAVRFFCLPESDWLTGQCLLVDGGHSLRLWEQFPPRAGQP